MYPEFLSVYNKLPTTEYIVASATIEKSVVGQGVNDGAAAPVKTAGLSSLV